MGNIEQFPDITCIKEHADDTLEKAKGQMDRVIFIGFSENDEFIFGGSFSEVPEILFLLELAKKELLEDKP